HARFHLDGPRRGDLRHRARRAPHDPSRDRLRIAEAPDMSETFGSGLHRYERFPNWPRLPRHWPGWMPSDAAVNSAGEIYVVAREADVPVTIWSPDGEYLGGWGAGQFSEFPHGIYIGPTDNVWIVDRNYHIATEFTPTGTPLRVLGKKLSPSPTCDGRV